MSFDPGASRRIKSILGGSVGNLVEWYDWYVYSAFSLYFAPVFFPTADETAQLLNTSAIFAVGFLMRPLGGWLTGLYADRQGRKAALTLSIACMCFGSLMIAAAPTYAQAGVWSPAVLVLARLIQGLSVGGEYGTSATYLSEMATPKFRGFYSSFQYVTLIMGQLLAMLVLVLLQQVFLTQDELARWGWRIPFAIGAACAVVVYALRRRLDETAAFTAVKRRAPPRNLTRALLQHPRALLKVVGLTLGGTVAFYTYTTYMQKFLVASLHYSKNDATLVSSAALLPFMLMQPAVGLLSDKIGRKPLLLAFGILGTLLTVPMMTALSHAQSPFEACALIFAALIVVSGYTSINAVVKAELFPAEIRALGVGLPYAVTVSVFGGTAEYIALWLKNAGHESWYFWYVTACIACSLLVYGIMKDSRTFSALDTDAAA